MSRTDAISVPSPCSPAAAMRLHRCAVQFLWDATEDGFGYQIQWASRPGFEGAHSRVVQNLRDADRHACFPEMPLSPGEWFWRVRTMNREGMFGRWSPAIQFTVVSDSEPPPPEYALSPSNPLFILYSGEDIAANWASVPDTLKPYTALRVDKNRPEEMYALCELAQQRQIPLMLQLAGPHDSYGGQYARIPLPDVETLFQRFPVVRGVQIVEQACQGGLKEPAVKAYLLRMMELTAAYGKVAVWADGFWHGCNIWLEAALDAEVFDTMRRCRDYMVPVWKMNCGWSPLKVHAAVFGLWMSGAATNWGVEPESWFWYEAGHRALGEPQRGFKEGDLALCPDSFWGQMILLGLSSGATVYCIEPPSGIWDAPGILSKSGAKVVFPLFQSILNYGLIPSREQVQEKVKAGCVASEADAAWQEDAGPLQPVFEAAYGIAHPAAILPARGANGWLPILSPYAVVRDAEKDLPRIDASSFRNAREIRDFFVSVGPAGPPENQKHAWALEVGDLLMVMNRHENQDAPNCFRAPLRPPYSCIEGEIGVNGYLLCRQMPAGMLRIHANGRSDRPLKLRLSLQNGQCHIRESHPAAVPEALQQSGQEISGLLDFSSGAVVLTIAAETEPEQRTGL